VHSILPLQEYCGDAVLTGYNGTFTSHQGEGNYKPNSNCVWYIEPDIQQYPWYQYVADKR
jgi:hypothetical protein